MVLFLSLVLVLLSHFHSIYGKRVEDTLNTDAGDNWAFLTRFCFKSEDGKLEYEFEYKKDYGRQELLFYYDTPGQWHSAYRSGLSCQEKYDILQNNNIFPLDAAVRVTSGLNSFKICDLVTRSNGEEWYTCSGSMNFKSRRERWWYLALSRCGPAKDPKITNLYLKYKLHMTNGDTLLYKEFSADEFYILPVNASCFFLYIILFIFTCIIAIYLSKKRMLHTTYKMFLVAIGLWLLHLQCSTIAWFSYGDTGWRKDRIEVLGRIIQSASSIVFIMMLILMAKGYTISRRKLSLKANIKIIVFIVTFSAVTIGLFIWEAVVFDEGKVLYYLESFPGYFMITLKLIGWLWFTKAIVFTMKYYAKPDFYILFYTVFTIWFWAGPICDLLAMAAMEKWTREKTINGVQQFVGVLGHVMFLIFTLPCKVNDNFIFKTRTSQIASNPEHNHNTEDSNRYSYGYGNYSTTDSGPNLEMFVTTKAGYSGSDDFSTSYGPLPISAPPPSYPQALNASRLPPINTPPENTMFQTVDPNQQQMTNNTPNNPNNALTVYPELDEEGPSVARLPPLVPNLPTDAEGGVEEAGLRQRAGLLPPIRGSGLDPVVGDQSCPKYADLFQVKNTASETETKE